MRNQADLTQPPRHRLAALPPVRQPGPTGHGIAAPALPSIIQSQWDHEFPGTGLKLVLSGSHVTAMKRLTEAAQPLYGRGTGLIQVDPFGYRHVGEFVSRYTAQDKIRVYGIFGGLPGHLALISDSRSLAANVARIALRSTGRLYDEAPHAFDAFVADAAVPNSIVEAIASGETRWHKISRRVGKAACTCAVRVAHARDKATGP